jgi:putative salt-induced outer membrane protein YdiY
MQEERVIFECDKYGEIELSFASIKGAVRYENGQGKLKQYRGKTTASGARESGNVKKQDWALDTNIFFRFSDFRHELWVKYWAESREQQKLQQRASIDYQFDWFFAPKTFWSTKLAFLKDDPLRIEKREALGTGIGYQFWETQGSALSVETGPEYVSETTYNPQENNRETENNYTSWGVASNYRIRFPREVVFFTNMAFLQSLEKDQEWEAESNSGLSLPIAGGVTADLSYRLAYDNNPPEGKIGDDSRLRLGLGYQW